MQVLWLCRSQRGQLEQRGRRARVLLAEWAQRFERWWRRAVPKRRLTPKREVVCSCVKSFSEILTVQLSHCGCLENYEPKASPNS